MPRGARGLRRGKLKWNSRKANRGRKGALGQRKKFPTWKVVQEKLRRTRTVVIPPSEEEREARKAAEQQQQ